VAGELSNVRLSIVIPVFNGLPYLADQLRAIASQDAPFGWETIVVDNGSSDASRSVIASFGQHLPGLSCLDEPARGKAAALNRGANAAVGELLVFLDQDDVIAPGYLAAMAEALERHPIVAARLDESTLNPERLRASRPPTQAEGLGDPFGFLPCATGCSIGVRRAVFREIGGFDPAMRVCDDVDFSWRAQLAGYAVHFVPDAVVYYRRRETLKEIFLQGRDYGASGPALYEKYGKLGMPRRSPVAALRFHAAAIARLVAARSWSDVAFCSFLLGYRFGLIEGSARHRVLYL
jgi:GT2 family glycosyltransferase